MKRTNKHYHKIMKLFIIITLLRSMVYSFPELHASEEKPTKLAIVIDDLGNNMEGTSQILSLPIPVTVAIMPFMPSTKSDAELAHKNGKQVIVHMPMEAMGGKASWLGPGAIKVTMSDQEIRKSVEAAIADVPHAVGMNNHMGSKITQNEHIMAIVLEVCKEHNLYFLDSKTSSKSVVAKVAQQLGVPYIENNIFLDDQYNAAHIANQMNKVLKTTKDQARTVVIGHVGPPGKYTSSILESSVQALLEQTEVVPLIELIEDSIIDDKIM